MVIVPQVLDAKGYLHCNLWFQSSYFRLDFETEIQGLGRGYQHGSMQIWLLKHMPNGDPAEFSKMDAQFMSSVVGLRFNLNVNARRAKTADGISYRKHEIEARYFDERGTQLLNINEAKCQLEFTRAKIRLETD